MKRISIAAVVTALVGLTACGGGGGGSTNSALPGTPIAPQGNNVSVQFSIKIPQSVRLSPKYISSMTQSAQIIVAPMGGTSLPAVTINCTTVCSGTVPAPVGSDTFTVNLFDQQGAAGNLLSTGSTPQTIVAGTANSVTMTFSGVVASITVSGPSTITTGTPSTAAITVVAKDAARQSIVGPFNNPITMAITGDVSSALSFSKTTLASSADAAALTLIYNGAPAFSAANITASASGAVAPPALAIRGVAPAPASPVSYLTLGTNRADGVISGTSTQATIVAISSAGVLNGSGGTIPTGAPSLTLGGTASTSTGRVVMGHANPEPVHFGPKPLDEQILPGERLLLEREAHIPSGRASASAIRTTKAYLPTTLNSTQGVWVQNGSIGGGAGTYTAVASTLANISTYGYIWIDNTLLAANGGPLTSADVAQIGSVFDNSFTSDTARFAGALYTASAPALASSEVATGCDATGASTGVSTPRIVAPDTRIAVMVVNPASLGSGVGGYFSSGNYFPQPYANCVSPGAKSNESAMIIVGYNTGSSKTYELQEDLVRGTAHELQHLINYVNHRILVPRNSSGGFNYEDVSFNEGLSMLSQDFAVKQLFGSSGVNLDVADAMWRASSYLRNPQNYSISGFIGNNSSGVLQYNCGTCYGAEYMFQRYLYDRFGGDVFLNKMETSALGSFANIQNATGQPDAQILLNDFAVAMATSNTNTTTDPRFNFTNLNLRSTYTDQFGSTVTLSGPGSVGTIPPGGTLVMNPGYAGSFIYATASSLTSAGSGVHLTEPTGNFKVNGALIQK